MNRRGSALKGQKLYHLRYAFALSGRRLHAPDTQGDALGWELVGLSGRLRIAVERRPLGIRLQIIVLFLFDF